MGMGMGMGWNPSSILIPSPFERRPSRNVKQLLEDYREKCISTYLLYPTFRSSSVIMTLGAARTGTGATAMPGQSPRLECKTMEPEGNGEIPIQYTPPIQGEGSAFLRFWWTDATREAFLDCLPTEDLGSFRQACHDFSVRAAPVLFADITVTFRASTFSKPARMAALERIGHHVRTLTFRMPHTAETFLPPLLDSTTGEERVFIYQPRTGPSGGGCVGPGVGTGNDNRPASPGPKYGSWEMTDLLTKQYGPLFHAATNVPAFIRALTAMSSIAHLKISCPGQEPSQRYRRSTVDYALISLRMAVERAPLTSLRELSLTPIHAGGILYLRSGMGFGASPNSVRRWAQIRRLTIHMDSWAFDAPNAPTDHLKLLHHYLVSFSSNLRRLAFRWNGAKGPCPFTLDTEPTLLSPSTPSKTSSSPRSTPSPLPSSDSSKQPTAEPCSSSPPPKSPPPQKGLHRARFRRLRHAELCNAYPDASQLNRFINRHRHSLQECDFDAVELRSGNWDEALAVLTRISGSERWKEEQTAMAGLHAPSPAPSSSSPPPVASPATTRGPTPVAAKAVSGNQARDLCTPSPAPGHSPEPASALSAGSRPGLGSRSQTEPISKAVSSPGSDSGYGTGPRSTPDSLASPRSGPGLGSVITSSEEDIRKRRHSRHHHSHHRDRHSQHYPHSSQQSSKDRSSLDRRKHRHHSSSQAPLQPPPLLRSVTAPTSVSPPWELPPPPSQPEVLPPPSSLDLPLEIPAVEAAVAALLSPSLSEAECLQPRPLQPRHGYAHPPPPPPPPVPAPAAALQALASIQESPAPEGQSKGDTACGSPAVMQLPSSCFTAPPPPQQSQGQTQQQPARVLQAPWNPIR